MSEKISLSITEVTIVNGKPKNIHVRIDGKPVDIPIDETMFAFFQQQFNRENPTALQRRRFGTLMNIIEAAYKKGFSDAYESTKSEKL